MMNGLVNGLVNGHWFEWSTARKRFGEIFSVAEAYNDLAIWHNEAGGRQTSHTRDLRCVCNFLTGLGV